MIRRPPRSTLFPTRRSSDLTACVTTRSTCRRSATSRRRPPPRCRSGSRDRKSTRLNSSHTVISYAVFCLKKKKKKKKKEQLYAQHRKEQHTECTTTEQSIM